MSVTDASAAWTPDPEPSRRARRGAAGSDQDRGLDWTPPPLPPREPSYLGRVTLALAFIVAGTLVSLDVAGAASITAAGVLSAVLLTLGLGLAIGSLFGRARWLALPALVLVPFVVATSFVSSLDIDLGSGFGERQIAIASGDDLAESYALSAGQFTLRLDELDPGGETVRTAVRLGAGEIVVYVPEDITVVVEADADLGEIDLPGGRASGQGIERSLTLPAREPATGAPVPPGGTLELDLSVGVGSIRVVPVQPSRATTDLQESTS